MTEFAERGTIVVRSDDRRNEIELAARDVIRDALHQQLRAFSESTHGGRLHPDAGTADDSRRALIAAQGLRAARTTVAWHALSNANDRA